MNTYKLSSILIVLPILASCSSLTPAIPTTTPTNHPAASAPTVTTITPTETATSTPTETATSTPTETAVPENWILNETGFDIAQVKVEKINDWTVKFTYRYRIQEGIPLEDLRISAYDLMSGCGWTSHGLFHPISQIGEGDNYISKTENGECSFENIRIIIALADNRSDPPLYSEEVSIDPVELLNSLPSPEEFEFLISNVIIETVNNVPISITFDYSLDPRINFNDFRIGLVIETDNCYVEYYQPEESQGLVKKLPLPWTPFCPWFDYPYVAVLLDALGHMDYTENIEIIPEFNNKAVKSSTINDLDDKILQPNQNTPLIPGEYDLKITDIKINGNYMLINFIYNLPLDVSPSTISISPENICDEKGSTSFSPPPLSSYGFGEIHVFELQPTCDFFMITMKIHFNLTGVLETVYHEVFIFEFDED